VRDDALPGFGADEEMGIAASPGVKMPPAESRI